MAKNFSVIARICELVVKYSIYALVALMPILFLPWTSDVLDFNKQMALIFLVFIGLFAWLIKTLVSGKFKINLSKINVAVLALFLAYVVSTIFSLDKYGSFWGWPRIASEALLTIISLSILYFLTSTALSKKEISTSIAVFLCSSLVAILYGLLQLLGIFVIPFGFLKSTSFNTVGLAGGLGILAAVLLPLVIILEVVSKKWLKIVYGVGLALITILLVVINYPTIWWVVLASSVILILFLITKKEIIDPRWLALPMFFLVLSLFFVSLSPQISVPSRAIEVNLNQQSTLDIATRTLRQNPITGSGPGTFIYDFSKHKDASFNQGDLWNLRFSTGASKLLTLLATIGILGTVCFLILIGVILLYGFKLLRSRSDTGNGSESGEENYPLITIGVLSALLSEIFMFFLYSSNLSLDFLFFLLLASFAGLYVGSEKEYKLSSSSFLTLVFTFLASLSLIFGLGLLVLQGQRYAAEVNYYIGSSQFSAGQTDKGLARMEGAIKMNSNLDIYLTDLSQAYLSKLSAVVNDKSMSDTDKSQKAQLLINNSVNAGKMATDLNPNNVSDWSIRGYVYQNLIPLKVAGMDEWAIKSYESAIALEPTNPYYPTQIGLVYMAKASLLQSSQQDEINKNLASAMDQFNKAIQLKSDYASARYQIAMVYQAQGKAGEELKALEDAKKYAPNDVGLAFQIGLVYYQEKDYKNASSEFQRAVSLSPNYSNALYFLGLTYSQLGKTSDAISVIQKVADLNPNNADVVKVLSNLKAGKSPLDGIGQETPSQAPISDTPAEKPGTPTTPATTEKVKK
jgi:tetratricopeptide (TPR) repeat protein/O-antigen ligase